MEKKKRNLIIGIAAVVVLAVILFFVFFRGKNNQYCASIPKDAVGLVRIDAASVFERYDAELSALIGKKNGIDALSDQFGVDLKSPIYGFATVKGATGIVAKMKSTEELKTMSRLLGAKATEKQGYNWIQKGDFVVCFNKNKLLAMQGGGMNIRKDMIALMEQDEEESIMSTQMFENLGTMKEPIVLFTSLKSLPKEALSKMALAGSVKPEDMDLDIAVTLDIVKDKLIMAFQTYANSDAMKKYYDEYASKMKKIDGSYISSVQNAPIVWGSMSIPGKLIADGVSKNLAELMSQMPKGNAESQMLVQGVSAVVKTISCLDGDVNFTLTDAQSGNFMVQAKVKDNSVMDLIGFAEGLVEGESDVKFKKVNDNSFTVTSEGKTMWGGVNGEDFFFANNLDLLKTVGQEVETGLESLKSEICNNYFYVTVDVQQILVPLLMNDPGMRQMGTLLKERLSQLDRLTLSSSDLHRIELALSVKDGQDFVKALLK